MYDWLNEGKAYLTVLYNIGTMIALGAVLGLLMCKISNLISKQPREEEQTGDEDKASSEE